MFLCSNEAFLREFDTHQIYQALLTSMVTSAYVLIDGRIKKRVVLLFRDCMLPVTLVNGVTSSISFQSGFRDKTRPLM